VQTLWGLCLVCFTVLLFKITKYINMSYKEDRLTPDNVSFRESLCILLSKVNGVLIGKYRWNLDLSKYYFKTPLEEG
jgi:hypothetical protein